MSMGGPESEEELHTMKLNRRIAYPLALATGLVVLPVSAASAMQSPSTGQPGNPTVQCGMGQATSTPGQSSTANGSPFNSSGTAGNNYAGNPGTASKANSNSTASVSQYDIACGQVSAHSQG